MTTTKISSGQTESLHARIPQETLEALDQIAQSVGRSRNWVFNEALQQFVELQRWQTELIKKRLKEADAHESTFLTHNEIANKYEKRLKKKLGI